MADNYNILDAAKDLITGNLDIADDETIIARTSICCECEVRAELTNICTACGCFIPAKVRLTKSTCPMEKW